MPPKSRRIQDYLEIPIEKLRADEPAPASLHLYAQATRQILLWLEAGKPLTRELLEKSRARRIERVWIHRDDEPGWRQYVSRSEPASPGTVIRELLGASQLEEKKRSALVASVARGMLASFPIERARAAVREILDDALPSTTQQAREAANELWSVAMADPELRHGVDVATYAVLFALSFGRIEPGLLADVAVAGLLHDIGLCELPASVVRLPWTSHLHRHQKEYALHVEAGIRLLNEVAPGIPPRVKSIMLRHHEKFDGSGYPQGQQGLMTEDLGYLVAMADRVESMTSGRWDGKTRSLHEAFDALERVEAAGSAPQHFHPDVFAAILRWMREDRGLDAAEKTVAAAREKARRLLGKS